MIRPFVRHYSIFISTSHMICRNIAYWRFSDSICDCAIAMKREVNPRASYKKNTMQFIAGLSHTVGIEKKFIDMTRDDVLCYLDNCRKPENEDRLHKWIGTNFICQVLCDISLLCQSIKTSFSIVIAAVLIVRWERVSNTLYDSILAGYNNGYKFCCLGSNAASRSAIQNTYHKSIQFWITPVCANRRDWAWMA